jgi:hypothetical protein
MDEENSTPAPAVTPEQTAADLKEFQKLAKYADRKKFWQEHPSIQGIISEVNFHA